MIINNDIVPKGSDVETILRCPTLFDLASNSVKEEVIRKRPDLIQYAKRPSESLQMLAMITNSDAYQYINHPTEKVSLYAVLIAGHNNVLLDTKTVIRLFDTINELAETPKLEEDMGKPDVLTTGLNTMSYTISLLLNTKSCSKWFLFKSIWRMIFGKTRKVK